jgi:diguanylate cyclase (GGDEF)-like protein/PAS domain S-box-containing protein
VRLRLQRRLARAGAEARRAVDPWAAEAELGRGEWDVVVWAAPRLERLARGLLAGPATPATLLVLGERASSGDVADALAAGYADVARADMPAAELTARAVALGRRAAEIRALREAGAAFRELAEGSRDLLMRVDAAGTVLFASAAARELLGRAPAELRGVRVRDLCHPDDVDALARALEGDMPPRAPLAHRLGSPAGGWTWVETTVRSLRDGTGRLVEAHTDSRDVGERVRAEAEQDALQRVTAAVAADRELGAVAGLVAREAAVLAGCESAAVVRLHGDEGLVVGAAGPARRVGERVPLAVVSPRAVVVPVVVEGRPWGAIDVRAGSPPPAGAAERLRPLADLVSLSVVNARRRERLVALATTDPLTGLANRRTFHERLDAECARADRAGSPLALVMIDLDHFKRVNDTHGHQVGDEVLREVARRLQACRRREDVVARMGGEELAWLLPGADAAQGLAAAERLRRDIRSLPFDTAGRQTASIGVAVHGDDGPAGLVRRADLALYRAKSGGRDACVGAWQPPAEVRAAPSA